MKNNTARVSLYPLLLLTHSSLFFGAQEAEKQLSRKDYKKYMQIIQQKDIDAYENIKVAEKKLGKSCLIKSQEDIKKPEIRIDQENPGYPAIILPRRFFWLPIKEKEEHLSSLAKKYTIIPDIKAEEQEKVMDILEEIAPKLYRDIDNRDPKGHCHIGRSYQYDLASASYSPITGLPILFIAENFTSLDHEHQKFLLGHELGHFGLEHHLKENSHLDSKQREYAADIFSVLNLRTDIEKTIFFMKDRHKKSTRDYTNSTHPSWKERAEALEKLLPHISALREAHDPEDIHWKKIAKKIVAEKE